jgi:hypothetical protein
MPYPHTFDPAPIGSWKFYWIGSSGPFYYDDGDVPINDPSAVLPAGQLNKAIITDDQLSVGTQAVLDEEVLRLVDVGDIVGDVYGPAAHVDNAIARWDGINTKKLQNSLVLLDDSGNVALPNAAYLSTDEVRARDGDGLKLYDDGGNGIFVEDGGYVGVGILVPTEKLDVDGDINIPTGQSYKVAGTQVLTNQQAAEADAAAVSAISLAAGTDQVNRTAFNTSLATLVTEVNAIKTVLNSLLAKLRTHGIIDT